MKTYHELAAKTGRKFVISTKVAHLFSTLHDDPGIKVPDPKDNEHLLIYKRIMNRYGKWERDYLDEAVDAKYVHNHQSKLILHLDFTYFTELIDIRPDPGAQFIHSMSEPFEDEDPEDIVKTSWCNHFGMKRHQAHASGHCSKEEIFNVLNEISPKKVFPVHTEEPELFKVGVKTKVLLPKIGESNPL